MRVSIGALALLAVATAAYCQIVTAEAKVRIDGRVQTVRKINGRWWSNDNRQLTPSKGGFIWWISSEKGKSWTFHHHRPVKLESAESLHLFMSSSAARDLLGEPNESVDREASHLWTYYAENGTGLFLQFDRDELIVARYERSEYGVAGKPVQSVANDLGGRDVYKVMADRAWQQRSPAEYAKYRGQNQAAANTLTVTFARDAADARPGPPKRRIDSDVADFVTVGMTRADVVRFLGEPSGGMHISSGDSDSETMTYALDPSGAISFAMEKGKVVRISR